MTTNKPLSAEELIKDIFEQDDLYRSGSLPAKNRVDLLRGFADQVDAYTGAQVQQAALPVGNGLRQARASLASHVQHNVPMTVDDLATLLSWLPEDAHPAAQGKCPACGGNDGDMPCAYPSDGQKGCLRDARLVAQGKGRTPEVATREAVKAAIVAYRKVCQAGTNAYPKTDEEGDEMLTEVVMAALPTSSAQAERHAEEVATLVANIDRLTAQAERMAVLEKVADAAHLVATLISNGLTGSAKTENEKSLMPALAALQRGQGEAK